MGGLLGGSVGAAAGWPACFVGGAADGSNLHLLAPCLPVAGGRNGGLGRGVAQAGVSVQGSGGEDRGEGKQSECKGEEGGRAREGGGESKREGGGAEGKEGCRKEGRGAGWEEQRGRRGGERRGKE